MARILLVACGIAAAAGCGYKERAAENLQPNRMYEKAHGMLMGGDYRGAVRYYEALDARYPFSQEARQARLDIIYAYYRAREQESAVDAADQFVRENPTHPRVDYAMYLRGLVYFERSPNFLERWFNTDLNERPPQDVRRAFDAFDQLIKQRPEQHLRARRAPAHGLPAQPARRLRGLRRGPLPAAPGLRRGDRPRALLHRELRRRTGGPPCARDHDRQLPGLGLDDLAERSQEVFALNYPAASSEKHEKKWWRLD